MLENNAKSLRDISLILALLVFLAGVVQVVLFAFNASIGTGLTERTGVSPHSFAAGAEILTLISIAFGIIHSSARKN